ncbi:methyl-accepting chemotaxis protein [Pseudoalteromonas luteoviolacea]|uniref:methyl-accepting chemotaxis protein n=1 Tax=Pseudoalteromonas luteoviolacea TaxID=43657 RepID=UPI001F365360|nr:methyl-accepting chemotaxis protein [Pseudoalteromonas luteoviolacea]MCF6438702.1 methyl-accepting chemotaxis protein [Pseudoalteromonas luteoviolacea]
MLIKTRLLISFMLIGLIPAGILAMVSLWTASTALEKQAYNQLTSIKQIKHKQIDDYLNARKGDLSVIAKKWQLLVEQNPTLSNSDLAHNYHSLFDTFINEKGFYDFFVIERDGLISYTVAKESDYNTNLVTGPFNNSGLATLFTQVISARKFILADYSAYAPSNNDPAAFIGIPVIIDGQVNSVLALQLSIDAINAIMQQRDGMGETGESYLVGNDFRMRSDSFLDPINHTVIASFAGSVEANGVDTVAVRRGLQGISDTEIIIDYNGNPVLSAYLPYTFAGLKWVLLAEIDKAEAFAPVYKLYWIIALIFLLTVLSVAGATVLIARSVLKPLGGEPIEMRKISERIAAGDLREQFGRDENAIGVYGAMRQMNTYLTSVIGTIVETTAQLASTATQTSAASEQANASLQEQHANIEQVAEAIQQTSHSIDEVATNARNVADLSLDAEKTSLSANQTLRDTVVQMEALSTAVENSETAIKEVEYNTQNISRVIEVIQAVTEQTNLLALNAAIEAARAGEHGRGFAVVADEVRQLAQKTQASTADIENMIANLQSTSQTAVSEMHASAEATKQTITAANDSASLLEQSVHQINQIALSAQTIAQAAQEQSATTEEISYNVESIRQAAIDNAAGADQVTSASLELDKQSKTLKQVTSAFKLPQQLH